MRNALLAAVAASLLAVPAAADPLAEWSGEWQGTCEISPAHRGVSRIAATLTIGPTSARGRYTWRQVYEESGPIPRLVKNYELVAIDAAKGHYALDERNGLMLDAFLAARALHIYFLIGGNRIPVIYLLQDVLLADREIVIALPSFGEAPVRKTCLSSRSDQCAESYRMDAAQICHLRRRR